ncbi:Glycogen debranching enzyme, partial [hydrothermal vent metagenome]
SDLAFELEDNWKGALDWIELQRDEKGFLRYTGAQDGKGLINKCWKDSNDSMSYSDGSLAGGALAIIEVQGYLCAAYEAGAHLIDIVSGDNEQSEQLIALRHQTIEAIDTYFWMPDKNTYALALDKDGNRLDVVSSNPGHLLWSGAVKKSRVKPLTNSMFDEVLWSGWGLRTLSASEKRYNPLSYHNGSIWPHDTALFGAGLFRYGYVEQFAKVTEALSDLADIQHDLRLPELVGGYDRNSNIPPLPYVESCRPQAWAAASLIYMLHPHRAQKSASRDVVAA